MREKKILNLALVASRTGEINEENLATQERRMFREILETLAKHGKILEEIFSNNGKKKPSDKDLNNLSVEILSDVSEFVGTDMKEYGPFSKGAVVRLPLKIAKLLSERKMAVVK